MFLGFDFTLGGLLQHAVSGFFGLIVTALTDPVVGFVQGIFDSIFAAIFNSGGSSLI